MILHNFKKISHQFTYQFGQLVPHNHLHWGHEILLEDNSIRNSNTFQILGLFEAKEQAFLTVEIFLIAFGMEILVAWSLPLELWS